MKKINYHTHTYHCGHANGSVEEMVKAAIDMGIEELGISEHIALPKYRKHLICSLPAVRSVKSLTSLCRAFYYNGPKMRIPVKKVELYLDEISNCQKKYEKDIKIYKGFEAEGFSEYYDYYQKLLYENKIDYLILGHHFHKHCIHSDYNARDGLPKKALYQYCNDVEKALETKLFSYIAHPDLFLMGYKKFDLDAQTVSRRICMKAKELNIPLELNAGGIRKGLQEIDGEMLYLYPNAHFWDIAAEVGNDVVFGLDAHNPKDFDLEIYETMVEFAKKHNLNVIDHIELLKGDFEKFQGEYDIR